MNKIPIVVIGLGIIITLIGIVILTNLGEDAIETIEEGVLYEGADGEMKITDRSPVGEACPVQQRISQNPRPRLPSRRIRPCRIVQCHSCSD